MRVEPWPSYFPCFFQFPCFFRFPISLAFLCVFPLFSKDFRGSAKRRTLAFFGKKPLLSPKKARVGGSGKLRVTLRPKSLAICGRGWKATSISKGHKHSKACYCSLGGLPLPSGTENNGRVFIQSWRWDPPTLSRKILSFSQNNFGKFLRGGYPNRSSGIHRWGLDLSTGYPNTCFSWFFSGYPQVTLAFLPGDENFRIFSLRCLSRKLGSQHQLRIKTLPSEKQPKHKVFGRDIPRTSGRISGWTSQPKHFHPILATRAAIYRSLRALRARNRKKVSKRVFWGVWRKVSKNTRKSLKIHQKNTQKGPKIDLFRLFRVFFETFLLTPPKRPFLRLFCDFGPGGPGDSCKWRLGSQPYRSERRILFFCLRGRPWPEGADVHHPRGSQEDIMQENCGLIFRSLFLGPKDGKSFRH